MMPPYGTDIPIPGDEQEKPLRTLLDYLDKNAFLPEGAWEGWTFRRIVGGANNVLFRAAHERGVCAIKFTIRDSRNRAEREYKALLALENAGMQVAPHPLLVDADRYSQPVVVQTWLEGEVTSAPPTTDSQWQSLLEHYAAIHTLTPDKTKVLLSRAVLNADSVHACKSLIQQQVNPIPSEVRPSALHALRQWLDALDEHRWPPTPLALCRVDANTSNFVRRLGAWASVDWENSGWGDPAFEIADLMTHPAYLEVSSSRWERVVETYCDLRVRADETAASRIALYYKVMLLFWVIRLTRYLYEVPRGLDQRLVERPPTWEEEVRSKYTYYLGLAEGAIFGGSGNLA